MVEPGDTVKVKTEEGSEEKRFLHFKKKNQVRNTNAAESTPTETCQSYSRELSFLWTGMVQTCISRQ